MKAIAIEHLSPGLYLDKSNSVGVNIVLPLAAASGGASSDSHFDRMTLLTLYRTSKIGDCLAEALDEMIMQEKIPGDLGMKVMAEFDAAIYKALEKDVTTKTSFKGHLDSYRYCDQVWTMVMSDTNFRMETSGAGGSSRATEVKADKIKLVCVDERLWQQQPQQ